MLTASLSRGFPWGLCVLEDPRSSEEIPPFAAPGQSVSTCRTGIMVAILHEVDGEATASVQVAPYRGAGVALFDGEITSDSGELRIADATADHEARVTVGEGRFRVQVFVDQVPHSELVEFVLERLD